MYWYTPKPHETNPEWWERIKKECKRLGYDPYEVLYLRLCDEEHARTTKSDIPVWLRKH